MEMPERDELRKAYEDLADEVLIDIARNTQLEYGGSAVEVATSVLGNRGVKVPVIEEEISESAGLKGTKLEGALIEIPKFSADESLVIEEMLVENSIPYEKQAVISVSCSGCGCTEYVFYVQKQSFIPAVELIREYYLAGIELESSYFSGECPACGTALMNVENCTDCGLTLAGPLSGSLENHPFMLFLKHINLLSK